MLASVGSSGQAPRRAAAAPAPAVARNARREVFIPRIEQSPCREGLTKSRRHFVNSCIQCDTGGVSGRIKKAGARRVLSALPDEHCSGWKGLLVLGSLLLDGLADGVVEGGVGRQVLLLHFHVDELLALEAELRDLLADFLALL